MSWALPQAWSTRQFCTRSGKRCFARSLSKVLVPISGLPRFRLATPAVGVAVYIFFGSFIEKVAAKPVAYFAGWGNTLQPLSPVWLVCPQLGPNQPAAPHDESS